MAGDNCRATPWVFTNPKAAKAADAPAIKSSSMTTEDGLKRTSFSPQKSNSKQHSQQSLCCAYPRPHKHSSDKPNARQLLYTVLLYAVAGRAGSPSRCDPGCYCPQWLARMPGNGRPRPVCGSRAVTCWQVCPRESCSGPRLSLHCSCNGSGLSAGLQRRWMTEATLEVSKEEFNYTIQQHGKINTYLI